MERGASGSVARRVEDTQLNSVARYRVTVLNETVDGAALRCRQAAELCLNVEVVEKGHIRFVDRRRHTELLLEVVDCTNVIDVGVSAQDLPRLEVMLLEDFDDLHRILAGIDDDRFAGFLVAENRAIALEHPDGKCFEDHRTS
jgi:hypothetical protein